MRDFEDLTAQTKIEARPYQQRIISKALDLFCSAGLRSVLVESPTGSGKTVVGLMIAKLLQERLDLRIGWEAMRRNLLAQARAENEGKGINAQIHFLSMFDKDPPADLDLLVADEAHHGGASSMAHLYNVVRPRYILGLSATPYRLDRIDLCFDKTIKDAGIGRLIQDGYLSQYHHYDVPRHTPESVVECYCREPERWGQALAYFHTLEQCYRADALLKARGIRSDVVTGDSDRETQLEAFQAGKLDVLLNCLVLSEGFDFPALQTVFTRPSCRGLVIQQCGRVLRKCSDVPVKNIVQCQKTKWPFPRTALPAQQYTWLDGSWRSLTMNPSINAISGRVLKGLVRTQTELPKLLARRPFRRSRNSSASQRRTEGPAGQA
jgi:superfamily II DNA or RNA helicase